MAFTSALAWAALMGRETLESGLMGAGACSLLMFIGWRRGTGGGDLKLSLAMGLICGMPAALVASLIAFAIHLPNCILLRRSAFPFAPSMLTGVALVLVLLHPSTDTSGRLALASAMGVAVCGVWASVYVAALQLNSDDICTRSQKARGE